MGIGRKIRSWGGTLLVAWASSGGAWAAVVNLTIFNTQPLLDSDGVTTLEGTMFGGDVLQLVHAGGNGMVDPTDIFGLPSGDDSLLGTGNNPSHVGAGLVGPANGLFDEFNIYFDDSLVGTQVYLRFWNAYVMDEATHYGVSDLVALPAANAFGMAELDLAPLVGSSRTADFAFSAKALSIPEPSTLYLGALLLFVRRRWRDWSRHGSMWIGLLVAFGFQAALVPEVAAQPGLPLDVMSLRPIETYTGTVLVGAQTQPATASLIQLIDVGPDGEANPPTLTGGMGGDDSLVATGRVGEGVSPTLLESGQFSFAVTPRPAVGTRLVVRVYDTPVPGAGSRWGQSNVFTTDQTSVFDAGAMGLRAATIPLTADPKTHDADGDGFSD